MNQEYKTGKEYMDELDEEQLRLFAQQAQNDMQREMAEIEERSRKQFCKEIMPLLKPRPSNRLLMKIGQVLKAG